MSILAHNLKIKTNTLFLQLSVSHEIVCKPPAWDLDDRPASAKICFHNTLSLSQLFCQRSVAPPFETSVQIHWRGNCEIPPPRPQSHSLWGWEECCRDNSPPRLVEFCTGGVRHREMYFIVQLWIERKNMHLSSQIYPHDSRSYNKYRLNQPPKVLIKGRHWRWCLNFRYTSLAHLAFLLPVVILQTVSCLRGCAFHVSGTVREIIERYIINYFIIIFYIYIYTHTHTRTWRRVLSLYTRETRRHIP